MIQLYQALLVLVIIQSGRSSAEEDAADGLGSLHHLRGEAKPEDIRGLPEDLKGRQEMRFTPPQLSDEEERSPHMPAYLACDACIAVSVQIEKGLMFAHRHVDLARDIKQWDVIEAFENVCEYKTFE